MCTINASLLHCGNTHASTYADPVAKVLVAGRQHTCRILSIWHSFKKQLLKKQKKNTDRNNTHGGAQMSLSVLGLQP